MINFIDLSSLIIKEWNFECNKNSLLKEFIQDSLELMLFIQQIEEYFGKTLLLTDLNFAITIGEICEILNKEE